MVTFTEQDIASYKAALARYAAKEKSLEEKYTLRLLAMKEEYERLTENTPSSERSAWQRVVFARIDVYQSIVDDLRTPADQFISDFEFRSCK